MRILSCLLVLLLFGCADITVVESSESVVSIATPAVLDDGWTVASLEVSGFDMQRMQDLDRKLEQDIYTNVHMVAVEYDGKLVYEKYLSGEDQSWGTPIGRRDFDQTSLHDLRSVSKSVTALLLGIALGDDFESALSQPIIDFFPEYRAQLAPGAEKITLEQVLTMSIGLEWNEMDLRYSNNKNDEIRMYYQRDPVQYVLTKPVRDAPGTQWYYNGGTTMLLAALVEELSAKPFLEFGREKLAIALGIKASDVEWRGLGIWRARLTLPSAASGLRMRLRDLAKIGSLMLHRGRWQGKQVVPAAWVQASSQRHMEQTYSKWNMGGVYGYGYQWWHGDFTGAWGDFTAITGVGYGGQRLFVIPEKKLVITVFAGNYGTGIWKMGERVMSRIVAAAPD